MQEQPFSNRELEAKFEEIHKDVRSILAQTIKTNGRVSKLEDWKAYITGGLTILSLMIVPIFVYFITNWK